MFCHFLNHLLFVTAVLFHSSFAIFLCDLMSIFNIEFGFVSFVCVCVCIIDFSLVITMRFLYKTSWLLNIADFLSSKHFNAEQLLNPVFTVCYVFWVSFNYLLWIQIILLLLSFDLLTQFVCGWPITFSVYLSLLVRFSLL